MYQSITHWNTESLICMAIFYLIFESMNVLGTICMSQENYGWRTIGGIIGNVVAFITHLAALAGIVSGTPGLVISAMFVILSRNITVFAINLITFITGDVGRYAGQLPSWGFVLTIPASALVSIPTVFFLVDLFKTA